MNAGVAMAARSVCQGSSLVNPLSLPSVASLSSSSSVSYAYSCYIGRLPLHVTAQADGRKSLLISNKITEDRTVDEGGLPSRQSVKTKALVASAASVVAPEVQTAAAERLKSGHLKFKEQYEKNPELVKKLAEGQAPPYMIIACADSRVDPCTVLSLGPGEAFVLRNIANMVPAYSANTCSSTASAIEYAVLHLKVKHLVVIGHSRCGGIKALMGMKEDGSNRFSEFIEDWVLISKDASKKVQNLLPNASFEDQCTALEKEAVNQSLRNCLSFPFVKEKIGSGELTLHGGYYDFVNGAFESWTLDAE